MELKITQHTGNYYEFELDGQVVAYNSRNDVLVRQDGTCDFKTSEGANVIMKQKIPFSDITIVDSLGNEFTVSSINDLFLKLDQIEFFDWFKNNGGGSSVDRFTELLDTFTFIGNNGKVPVVNESLMRLDPTQLWNYKTIQEQQDVAITLSNASLDKFIAVKSVAGELKFVLVDLPDDTGFVPDQITSIQINRLGDEITIPAGAVWVINGNTFTNDIDYVTTIDPAATGMKRIDIIVARQDNYFEKIVGLESDSIAQEPVRPPGTLFVTRFDIDGNDITGGEEPNLGDAYVKKAYFNSNTYNLSGVQPVLSITMPIGQLIFTGSMTELQTIDITLDENLFNGSRLLINNRQSSSFILKQGGGSWPINFPVSGDYTVRPNEVLEFSVNLAGRLDFLGTNMGGGGSVESVTGSTVDNTDPSNPVVNAASESYVDTRADQARDEANVYTDSVASTKQNTLVSGTNIKTLNGNSLLGSGNLQIPRRAYINLGFATTNLVANTGWYVPTREASNILQNVMIVDTSYNNTTRILADGRTAGAVLPFDCRIKSIVWSSGSIGTPLTLNIHTWTPSSSTASNNHTVGSKLISATTGGDTFTYSGSEIDTTTIIAKNNRISCFLFNNNLATGTLRFNLFLIEVEEAI